MSLVKYFLWICLVACFVNGQDFACPKPNGYFADPSDCEAFFECRKGVSERKLCADGLIVNEEMAAFRYPCDYEFGDITCGDRPISNRRKALAKSGGPCQRQWGMFFAGDATNCGDYVNCVDGNPYLMKCPESLAWDAQSWNCNFADLVPTCNAEAFLGFTCPASNGVTGLRYPHPTNCAKFFYCNEENRPRLQTCDVDYVFNKAIGQCDLAANVPGCENYYQ